MKILIIVFAFIAIYSCGQTKDDQKNENSISKDSNGNAELKTCNIIFKSSDSLVEISIKANQVRKECNVFDEDVLISKINFEMR
jgi:predicted RND superfamily exporter protein